jgi:hypothetical protein
VSVFRVEMSHVLYQVIAMVVKLTFSQGCGVLDLVHRRVLEIRQWVIVAVPSEANSSRCPPPLRVRN